MVRYPCKGCMKRTAGCHAKCKEYLEAKELDRIDKEKQAADKAAGQFLGCGQSRRDNYYRRTKKSVKITGMK